MGALQTNDCITVRSYQFTADIAALGRNGRGYHRTRFIFDTADGSPKIVYRQDLTHLGWALGKRVRQIANNEMIDLLNIKTLKSRRLNSLLGLALDGNKLEGSFFGEPMVRSKFNNPFPFRSRLTLSPLPRNCWSRNSQPSRCGGCQRTQLRCRPAAEVGAHD